MFCRDYRHPKHINYKLNIKTSSVKGGTGSCTNNQFVSGVITSDQAIRDLRLSDHITVWTNSTIQKNLLCLILLYTPYYRLLFCRDLFTSQFLFPRPCKLLDVAMFHLLNSRKQNHLFLLTHFNFVVSVAPESKTTLHVR